MAKQNGGGSCKSVNANSWSKVHNGSLERVVWDGSQVATKSTGFDCLWVPCLPDSLCH